MTTDATLDDAVSAKIRGSSIFPSSFHDVSSEYKQTYGKNWSSRLARDFSGHAEGKAFTNAQRNIQRWDKGERGQGGQVRKPGKEAQGKLREIGKDLTPLVKRAPANGLTFRIQGDMAKSRGKSGYEQARTFVSKMDYATAQTFIQSPSYEELFYNIYGDDWPEATDVIMHYLEFSSTSIS